jgi:transportin-1
MLADVVRRALQNPRYAQILMPPLTNRWARMKDDDEDFFIPLLERRVSFQSISFEYVLMDEPPYSALPR